MRAAAGVRARGRAAPPLASASTGSKTRGQRLVLDLDQLDRLGGDVGIDGGDRGDLVAELAHLVALEREVVAQETDADLGRVVAGEHGLHARQRSAFDVSMFTMRAWACSLNLILPNSMPGRSRSWM